MKNLNILLIVLCIGLFHTVYAQPGKLKQEVTKSEKQIEKGNQKAAEAKDKGAEAKDKSAEAREKGIEAKEKADKKVKEHSQAADKAKKDVKSSATEGLEKGKDKSQQAVEDLETEIGKGKDKVHPGKGNAFGKDKELQGKEFGQQRAEEARQQHKVKLEDLGQSISQGQEKANAAKERIQAAKKALEEAKAKGNVKEGDYLEKMDRIEKAEAGLKELEQRIEKGKTFQSEEP